jgi:hypothetical protein
VTARRRQWTYGVVLEMARDLGPLMTLTVEASREPLARARARRIARRTIPKRYRFTLTRRDP